MSEQNPKLAMDYQRFIVFIDLFRSLWLISDDLFVYKWAKCLSTLEYKVENVLVAVSLRFLSMHKIYEVIFFVVSRI